MQIYSRKAQASDVMHSHVLTACVLKIDQDTERREGIPLVCDDVI